LLRSFASVVLLLNVWPQVTVVAADRGRAEPEVAVPQSAAIAAAKSNVSLIRWLPSFGIFAPESTKPKNWPLAIGASNNALAPSLCDDHRMRTTVLIVDDHEDFRQSASALLEAEGFSVVGGAADGVTALGAVERLRPDLVLLDIQLPDLDGIAVAERLAAASDPPRVVLISSRDPAAYGPRLQAAPALGFLAKRELSGASLAALVA
jgi:CheY-like chemotaxis protein